MSTHLIRISEVFSALSSEILALLGAKNIKKLGREYFLFQTRTPETIQNSAAARFIRWHLPVQHSWPCNPEKMTGFIEKAAQSLSDKFASQHPQTLLVGQLDPSSPNKYYKSLASNLRGRALQVFSLPENSPKTAGNQQPDKETLFCLVGKEGLFCGMTTPKLAKGLHPGGTKFISQNADDTISRAGAKLAEGLHFLSMHHPLPAANAHWLELGASPGGMTKELLQRDYRVSAIDRAPLDARLANHPQLTFFKKDVAEFVPPRSQRYDAILSDLNGSPLKAFSYLTRLKDFLKTKSLVIFTLKIPDAPTIAEIDDIEKSVLTLAKTANFTLIARAHLTYNRQEFTLFFEKT